MTLDLTMISYITPLKAQATKGKRAPQILQLLCTRDTNSRVNSYHRMGENNWQSYT